MTSASLTLPRMGLIDAWLSSPRFRRWAAAFPLTRPIARRRTRALFDVVTGFVYSQVLFACVKLNLFEILAEGPQTMPDLARRVGLPQDGMARLLAAAASLKLVEKRRRDRFGLGALGTAMVGNPGLVAMVQHHQLLYADLRDPVALLRGTHADAALAAYWPYADAPDPAALGADAVGPYTALMAASQPFVSDEILDAYDFGRHRCLLDVGGGDGSFLRAVAARHPKLELMLFDLPAVAERSRGVRAFGGDFTRDSLPSGADIVSLVRIVHDHGDDTVLTLLRAVRRALPPGGVVLIGEPMSGVRGAEAMGDAYFGFYLLAMGRGRARSFEELSVLLDTAGFAPPRRFATHTPLLTSVIVAGVAKSNQTVSLS